MEQARGGLGSGLPTAFNKLLTDVPQITAGAAIDDAHGGTAVLVDGSNDRRGKIELHVGTTPTTGTLCTVAWGGDIPAGRVVLLTAENGPASESECFVSAEGGGGFDIDVSASATLNAGDDLWFYYAVIE